MQPKGRSAREHLSAQKQQLRRDSNSSMLIVHQMLYRGQGMVTPWMTRCTWGHMRMNPNV